MPHLMKCLKPKYVIGHLESALLNLKCEILDLKSVICHLESVILYLNFPSARFHLSSEILNLKLPLCVSSPQDAHGGRTPPEFGHLRQKKRPNSLSHKAPAQDGHPLQKMAIFPPCSPVLLLSPLLLSPPVSCPSCLSQFPPVVSVSSVLSVVSVLSLVVICAICEICGPSRPLSPHQQILPSLGARDTR